MEVIKQREGFDLCNPGDRELRQNFHELAMREQCRVDLRNGPRMKRAAARAKERAAAVADADAEGKVKAPDGEEDGSENDGRVTAPGERGSESGGGGGASGGAGAIEGATAAAGGGGASGGAGASGSPAAAASGAAADDEEGNDEPLLLPRHPAIMAVLDQLMNPIGDHPSGNFGRWNFDGGGPGSRPHLTVGDIGAVIALPGCADQALHADIYHLLDHVVSVRSNPPPSLKHSLHPAPPSPPASLSIPPPPHQHLP